MQLLLCVIVTDGVQCRQLEADDRCQLSVTRSPDKLPSLSLSQSSSEQMSLKASAANDVMSLADTAGQPMVQMVGFLLYIVLFGSITCIELSRS